MSDPKLVKVHAGPSGSPVCEHGYGISMARPGEHPDGKPCGEPGARPDVLLTFVDAQGREWIAAAYVGELESDGQRMPIHDTDAAWKLRSFTVVQS